MLAIGGSPGPAFLCHKPPPAVFQSRVAAMFVWASRCVVGASGRLEVAGRGFGLRPMVWQKLHLPFVPGTPVDPSLGLHPVPKKCTHSPDEGVVCCFSRLVHGSIGAAGVVSNRGFRHLEVLGRCHAVFGFRYLPECCCIVFVRLGGGRRLGGDQ